MIKGFKKVKFSILLDIFCTNGNSHEKYTWQLIILRYKPSLSLKVLINFKLLT